MLLVTAKVNPFKSINTVQTVKIEKDITVLVGMNEAGKTVFLQALEKAHDALKDAEFDPVDDYPRKDLSAYLRIHKSKPADVVTLTYVLNADEVAALSKHIGTTIPDGFSFAVTHRYNNSITISISISEKPLVEALARTKSLSSDARAAVKKVLSIRAIPDALAGVELTEKDEEFLASVNQRIGKAQENWPSIVENEAWKWLSSRRPAFLYFSEYDLLPSKMNLADLAARSKNGRLEAEHRAVLALLRMADISLEDFTAPGGYEPLKAKIEGVSISLTDQIMAFWKQNEDLEVEVDIKADSEDDAPFNSGPNLYLRIKNRRHRGVSTPFRQRSRGFIWFFSFLVWFDSVQYQLNDEGQKSERPLLLLLDEPGLALHALAQRDLLRYIEDLAERHQVLYTTHSPFMVESERLDRVRLVEDRTDVGTVISENIEGSDERTIFPLQAALGWTIAQNLFITKRNLLVEGPSDLVYLKAMSARLEEERRSALRPDITVVPTGGLDKVVTFVALLGASGLELAVLHDYKGAPDQKLTSLVRERMISSKAVLDVSQFRDLHALGTSGKASDLEDLFAVSDYLNAFNQAFAKHLGGAKVAEKDLPPGDRIISRLERYLEQRSVQIRTSGGFNHYTVASHFASNPPTKLDPETVSRFEALFNSVNALF